MPALDGTDVVVAGTGHIYVADVGATEPADIAAEMGTGWTELGYTTTDGVEFSFDRTVQDIFGWQSRDPLRTIVTESPKTISFSLMQMHKDTWNYALGGGTTTSATNGVTWAPPAEGDVDERALAIEFSDGDKNYRLIYRRTMVNGAVTFSTVREDALSLPIESRVLAPPSGVDEAFIMQTDDPGFTADAA